MALVAGLLLVAPRADAALTEGPRLAAVYDLILNAQFERADAQLKDVCPPAPMEACQAIGVASLWWQILIHPESRVEDQRLNELAEVAIAASQAWTEREPQRAEAWFYLAGSYAPLVQWRALRGERLAAAREGSKIKNALERALLLDPALADAQFGIGLYHYYAAVAPAPAKMLRWLLFLPGGDRTRGLQEILEARTRGELLGGEIDYQLHLLLLWYERKPADAVALLRSLDARYPFNPLFLQRIAEVETTYSRDHHAAAEAWRELLDRADEAITELQIVIDLHPSSPIGASLRAEMLLRAARARRKF